MPNDFPRDPFILLSFINMKLRDCYPSMQALCEDCDVSQAEIDAVLQAAGFAYDVSLNKYW